MSAGVAPGPIIMAIGSPGTTRSSTKTITATPKSVGIAKSSRRRRKVADIQDVSPPVRARRSDLVTEGKRH